MFLSQALVANTIHPLCGLVGDGGTGGCLGQLWKSETPLHRLPEAQKTSGSSGADLLTMALGWWGANLPLCWGGSSMVGAPRNIISDILYQAPVCLSWRT